MRKSQLFLFIAWLIVIAAFLTTLYMSEALGWPVCHLCWYQRIALYPLVILLGIGAYQDDIHCIQYSIAFPIIGAILAIYQYLEQMIPGFSPIKVCGQDTPCSTIHIKIAGFITLPFLSAVACFAILLCLYFAKKN